MKTRDPHFFLVGKRHQNSLAVGEGFDKERLYASGGKVLAFLDLSGDGGVARLVGHDGNEDNSHCEKETFGKIAFSLLRHKNTPF